MPLYEYECKQCKRRTEKIQKFSDAPLTECPHCGGPLEQLIHAPAVSFKGSGWHADLYSSAKPSSGQTNGDSGAASSNSGERASGSAGKEAAPATPAASPAPAASTSSTTSDKK
jgi:putative FmdB family regulatory protein